jgi:SAM-dependent methyltransferase
MPKHTGRSTLSLALKRQQSLEAWFQTALGRALLADQRERIESVVSRVFGVHQLEIGISHRIPVGNASNLAHRFCVLPEPVPELPEDSVVALSHELPLGHDIVDLVILHHALDFAYDPHQTLREAARVLKSSGQLLIAGFNPFGLWGLRRLLGDRHSPWDCRFIAGKRVEDWLQLLDFRIEALSFHFYRLPINRAGVVQRSSWLDNLLNPGVPLGAYYLIHAQKQVASRVVPVTKWQRSAKVVGMPLANRFKSSKLPHDSESS